MAKYRKIPVVIEAFKFGFEEEPSWFVKSKEAGYIRICKDIVTADGSVITQYCDIATLEGVMRGQWGDFIILGVKGEIYPCKPDIFAETYEKVED